MAVYGFIGLGLIGGSIARAIREREPGAKIIAYNRTRSSAQEACEAGIVDVVADGIGAEFSGCGMIFLCAPVQKNNDHLELLKPYLSAETLLTDVGSVKTPIHEKVRELGLEAQFVGGHPMAGSERVGFAASGAELLRNAYYILTPTGSVPAEWVERFRRLVEDLGAIPLVLTQEQHDYIVAGVSHLPHIIASSLVGLVRDCDKAEGSEGLMKLVAAGGFKDITRIASSSAEMWRQICLTNGENITELLGRYIDSLSDIRSRLQASDGDAIYRLFDEARIYRDSFADAGSGPIKVSYEVAVDIADAPGALAAIATLFAESGINIKNIGILHNREELGGDLRVELSSAEDEEKAIAVLQRQGYNIHRK